MRFLKTVWMLGLLSGCSGESFEVGPADEDVGSDAPQEIALAKDGGDAEASAPDSDSSIDSASVADSGLPNDSAVDSGSTIDSAHDSADTGIDAPPPFYVSFAFPQSADFATNTAGSSGTAFSIGYCRYAGDYVEHEFSAPAGTTVKVTATVKLDDQTQGCAIGKAHQFRLTVDGDYAGTLSFTTGAVVAGERSMTGSFALGKVFSVGSHAARLTAMEDVCAGGGSWAWRPGGKIVFE